MSEYTEAVERNLEGIEYTSTGACSGCETCEEIRTEDMTEEDWYDLAGEPSFSWSACDWCGSTFGGDRYPAHGIDAETDALYHFNVCPDCVQFDAYGEEPANWHRTPREAREAELREKMPRTASLIYGG